MDLSGWLQFGFAGFDDVHIQLWRIGFVGGFLVEMGVFTRKRDYRPTPLAVEEVKGDPVCYMASLPVFMYR